MTIMNLDTIVVEWDNLQQLTQAFKGMMVLESIQVQGAPNLYRCHSGSLQALQQAVINEQWKKGLLIHGEQSWRVAKPYLDKLNLNLTGVRYCGECTEAEVDRLAAKAEIEQAEYILAVGGGKILDLGKACAIKLNIPYLLVPTLASNCAPWTPLSVFYNEEGTFIKHIVYAQNAYLVAVEPELILNSPVAFLRAGIGDTIAKWYEADVLARQLKRKPLAVTIALNAAQLCRDLLLKYGEQAIVDHENKELTPAYLQVIETIIMAGGMVGGFGERYGRIAGAHSIHNGLTALAETHEQLHGDKVAYGILVQLALENRFDEIEELLPYYRRLGLPAALRELGVKDQLDLAFECVAQTATRPSESIHLMENASKESVAHAMKRLEAWIAI